MKFIHIIVQTEMWDDGEPQIMNHSCYTTFDKAKTAVERFNADKPYNVSYRIESVPLVS